MIARIIKFAAILAVVLAATLGAHLALLHYKGLPLFDNLIVKSYGVNYLMALWIFVAILRLRKKFIESLGFIFMGGSMFKFVIFFVAFYPAYNADDHVAKLEFASFFVPYAICLILETKTFVNILNEEDSAQTSEVTPDSDE